MMTCVSKSRITDQKWLAFSGSIDMLFCSCIHMANISSPKGDRKGVIWPWPTGSGISFSAIRWLWLIFLRFQRNLWKISCICCCDLWRWSPHFPHLSQPIKPDHLGGSYCGHGSRPGETWEGCAALSGRLGSHLVAVQGQWAQVTGVPMALDFWGFLLGCSAKSTFVKSYVLVSLDQSIWFQSSIIFYQWS